jgi:DNA-binding NarL/FixJ family response regulator
MAWHAPGATVTGRRSLVCRGPHQQAMDLQLPRVSGVMARREITAQGPTTRVVVLPTFGHDDPVFAALRDGACAYFLKDASKADVLETIRVVHAGEYRLSLSIAGKVLMQFRALAAQSASSPVARPQAGTAGLPACRCSPTATTR